MKQPTIEQPTITLQLTDTQARSLIKCLRSTTRLLLGDYNELKELCYRREVGFIDNEEFEPLSKNLMRLFHPDLVYDHGYNSNWGIGNNKIPDANIIFDIAKVLEYNLSWRDNPLGGWTVNFDKPFGWSNQPLKCEFINAEDNIYVSFFQRLHPSINQMITKMGWKDNPRAIKAWIKKCKKFALHEHDHIMSTNTALPSHEYLTFFNEYIDNDGYVMWRD